MKRLILLSLALLGCGSEIDYKADPVLAPYVQEFYRECSRTPSFKLCEDGYRTLVSVKFKELDGFAIGRARTTSRWRGVHLERRSEIQVEPYLKEDPWTLRFVMYHELGHVIGLGHKDDKCIMSTYAKTKEQVEAIETEDGEDPWTFCVRELFSK